MTKPVIYIVGPFRGPDHFIIAENIRNAERAGLQVAKAGAIPLIPHSMYSHFQDALPDDFWLAADMQLLYRCDGLVLLATWPTSRGASAEREEALHLDMPIMILPESALWAAEVLSTFITRVQKVLETKAPQCR